MLSLGLSVAVLALASLVHAAPAPLAAPNCDANPGFHPVASGGDGDAVQFWYVGVDSTLGTVIVAHQGTDPSPDVLQPSNRFVEVQRNKSDDCGAIGLLDSVYLPSHLSGVTFKDSLGLQDLASVGNIGDFIRFSQAGSSAPPSHWEIHIQDSGPGMPAQARQDNTSDLCTTGDVPTIFEGNSNNHNGTVSDLRSSAKFELDSVQARMMG
ncbi:hypothetical protein B0H10DRAFT_1969465 [Mycena sp. CBHHK59/15]|nr:hypothetical protein B0H10DRAFT_1969465 [Mycena sp. CBHHK59/15]